jgi:predicted NBD/HSP70 family sugar kinase
MALKGTNQGLNRPFNRRIILETIRLKGPISRADIARAVDLSPQTVSTIIRELEDSALLRAEREAPRRRGQPATMLELNPEGAFAVGLHVTPARAGAVLVDLSGRVAGRSERRLDMRDPAAAFPRLAALVDEARSHRPGARVLGVGLAMPGPFDVEPMSFVGPTTMEGWKGVPIRERLMAETGLPVFIDIDSAASALGESLFGHGRGLRQFYYLYFGVGLGGAMVQDGARLAGAGGNAGEIGHLPLVADGELCPCGNCGCLERYVSLDALGRRFEAAGLPSDPAAIEAAIGRGEPTLDAFVRDAAPLLRRTVATIENLFDPESIIIGGIVPQALLEQLRSASEPLSVSVATRKARRAPRLAVSEIGADSTLLGAAVLAMRGVLSPREGAERIGAEAVRGLPDPLISPAPRFPHRRAA